MDILPFHCGGNILLGYFSGYEILKGFRMVLQRAIVLEDRQSLYPLGDIDEIQIAIRLSEAEHIHLCFPESESHFVHSSFMRNIKGLHYLEFLYLHHHPVIHGNPWGSKMRGLDELMRSQALLILVTYEPRKSPKNLFALLLNGIGVTPPRSGPLG